MALIELPRPQAAARPGATASQRPPVTVIALAGEHDTTTVAGVSAILDRAIADHRADVVIDLHVGTYMGTATVRVLTRARTLLAAESRALIYRAPSRSARRILELCALAPSTDDRPTTRPAARPTDDDETQRPD